MLTVTSLSKTFGTKTVLDSLSFSIQRGEIVGIVGPNGSGKTTLLNTLMGMLQPTSGSYQIEHGTKVGMSVSRAGFFSDLSVTRNLVMYAELMETSEETVRQKMTEFMIDFGNLRFGKLSAGMKQRVSLVLPFLSPNDLILLDEPSNHLDIDSILHLRATLTRLKESGVAFLVTSHIFSDLEKVCSRIIFLKNGRLIMDAQSTMLFETYGSLEMAYVEIFKNSKA